MTASTQGAVAPKPPLPQKSSKRLNDKTLKAKEFRLDKLLAWLFAALTLALVVGLYAVSVWVVRERPGGDTIVGYALGLITLVLYGVVAAYSWRHRRRAQKRAMTRTWMEVHLAFGLVSGVSAVLHSGPRFGAPLHGAFLLSWLLLILTGILGKFLSVWVPRRLTKIEDEALLVEDVVERQRAVRTEIEQLLQDADQKHVDIVNNVIPPHIQSPESYGKKRMKRSQVVESVYAAIKGDSLVTEDKRDWLKRMVTCLVEDEFLGKMLTYHYILRAWVPVHVALTAVCFPWLIIHIVSVLVL